MDEPLFVFIALSGASVLGFLFATSILRKRIAGISEENANLTQTSLEQEAATSRLKSECEARKMAIENLQKLTQEIENQAIEKDKELAVYRSENKRLQEEIQHLMDNPIEKVREIDVIREVPVLIFRDVTLPESRKDKAKKLMKAFQKGYLDEQGVLHASPETADNNIT